MNSVQEGEQKGLEAIGTEEMHIFFWAKSCVVREAKKIFFFHESAERS